MLITAWMVRTQRAIVRVFKRASATTVATACTAEQLSLMQRMAWHQLVSHAVLRCPGEGRYFLDLANWQRLRRHRFALLIGTGSLLALALILLLTRG